MSQNCINTSYLPNHMDSVFNHTSSHFLYIGDYDSALNYSTLEQKNIQTVITVAKGLPLDYQYSNIIKRHKVFMATDSSEYNISKHFADSYSIIEAGLQNGAVLVHCAAGISRSASIVIAYLMRKNKWSYLNSFNHVKSKRKVIKPNPGFEIQLRKYQHHLKSINLTGPYSQSKTQKSLLIPSRRNIRSSLSNKPLITRPKRRLSPLSLSSLSEITHGFRISRAKPIRG